MLYLVLEITSEAERYDDTSNSAEWEEIASSRAATEEQAKAMMLDSIVEMLNSESLEVNNSWLRLVHLAEDAKTVTKVEVF